MEDTKQPMFDMSKAVPLEAEAQPSPSQNQPKFDMSKAVPVDQNQKTTPEEDTPEDVGAGYGGAEAVPDLARGFAKGAGQTANTVSKIINKIPGVGETLAPKAGIEAATKMETPTNTVQKVGAGAEGIAEFFLGDEALKSLSVAERLGLASKVIDIATKHPVLGKIIGIGMNAMRTGTVGTSQALAHGATLPDALKQGAVAASIGATAEGTAAAAEGAASKLQSLKPRTIDVAGEPVPVSAQNLASDVDPSKPISTSGTAEGAQKFIDTNTQPAAVKATTSNLADSAIDKVNKLRAVRGETPFPSKRFVETSEDVSNLAKSEAKKTYKILDDAANEEHSAWEAEWEKWQADNPQPGKVSLVHGKLTVANAPSKASTVSTAQSTAGSRDAAKEAAKYEQTAWKEARESWLMDNPEPKTFSQMQDDVQYYSRLLKSKATSPSDRAVAAEMLPKAKQAAEDFIGKYGRSLDPNELRMANNLYAKSMQYDWISTKLQKATKGTEGTATELVPEKMNVNYETLHGMKGNFDAEFGDGKFEQLLGKDGMANWNRVIQALKNQSTSGTPFIQWAAAHSQTWLSHLKDPYNWLMNKLLFDPEFGTSMINAWHGTGVAASVAAKAAPATVSSGMATHRYDATSGKVVPNE